jgi:hypothetical protein
MNSPIEIHEFSTGIRPERTATGWVSRGFTGQYMNVTLDRIPAVVERAIANREFAVTEGASTEQPAVIGRVVGTGENPWSVMAVVTRGKDEKGRSLSVYRYFLSQGKYNLRHIIAWWESQNRPTFNPFDIKNIGQRAFFNDGQRPFNTDNHLPPELEKLPLNEPEPLLLPPQPEYDLRSINILAIRKSKSSPNNQPISWAFNVESLEKPLIFQVIQPASQRASQIFKRLINQSPQVPTPVVGDEEALKTAIRTLMNSSQVKPDAVQTIIKALKNEETTSPYWHTLFDGQGAKTAISQKIYSPQMVRLITLRAMVIPETLPEFLTWLNVKGGNYSDENQTVSLNFQAAIHKEFPKEQLSAGITFLLPHLLNQQITPEAFNWIFIKYRAWDVCKNEFINNVRYDLEIIAKCCQSRQKPNQSTIESLKYQNRIWAKLINYWPSIFQGYYQVDDYKPLAQLFEILQEYVLSAYFYQVSEGSVPKDVFIAASPQPSNQPYTLKYLGLTLKREVTLLDSFIDLFFRGYIVPLQLVIILLIIFSGGSFWLGSQVFPKNKPETSNLTDITANSKAEISNNQIPEDIKTKAMQESNINSTIQAIKKLQQDKKLDEIKTVLNRQFDYTLLTKPQPKEQEQAQRDSEISQLVEAIYLYQSNHSLADKNGYIKIDDETYTHLKQQLN